jgi:hypothetical protein
MKSTRVITGHFFGFLEIMGLLRGACSVNVVQMSCTNQAF